MSTTQRIPWALAAAVLLASAARGVAAAEPSTDREPARLTLVAGYHSEVTVYGIGAVWPMPVAVETLSPYGLDTRLGVEVVRWDGPNSGEAGTSFLWDAGVTPYLRWRPAGEPWRHWFLEAGLGVHLLSHTKINPARNMASAFQFGERVAVGFNFGPANRYEITAFVQHVSNGGIKEPNWGITYYGATLGIPLD